MLGVGIIPFLPDEYTYLGGSIMLGAVGLSFFMIYIFHHEHWWAIIPGGVLMTLAFSAYLAFQIGNTLAGIKVDEIVLGSAFFLGLSLTFLARCDIAQSVRKDEVGADSFRSLIARCADRCQLPPTADHDLCVAGGSGLCRDILDLSLLP